MPVKKGQSVDQKKNPSKAGKYRLINLPNPRALDFEFIGQAASGLRPFQYDLSGPDSDQSPQYISSRAMGVGVAVPNDSTACDKVLELVEEVGVRAVRIDLTYHHDLARMDELVDGLRALDVEVLLHLVQPLEEAEKMPDQEALGRWSEFVRSSLDHLSSRIGAVEIGSTINRAKWTRYTLEGFLAAWESAHKEVRKRDLCLIGPNVTDFEPQYNAGLLGMLKKRGLLPDIHSNNLFAERATEPENVDQKILGSRLKRLHGFDTKKKIRLLGAISRRSGIKRNWSTSAFWTLPRIENFLESSEEQMTDYLVRYFTICLSERAFERIYWGPLVSIREGLLDDGTGVVPKSSELDIVALHDEVPGEPDEWRKRPAFYAFRTIISFLGGSHFRGVRCAKKGIEIHEFSKGEQIIHIGWTKNGKVARLEDCYSPADLQSIESAYFRTGDVLDELPDFLTQSPVIFVWKKDQAPTVLKRANIVPNVVVAPSSEGLRHYSYSTEKWRGIVRASSRDEADMIVGSLGPEAISDSEDEGSLRKARNAVWKVKDPRNPGQFLVVKKPRRLAWNKKLLDRNKPSKALRSWNGTSELMRRGIGTPGAVAYFESTDPRDMMNNWFICDHLAGDLSSKTFFGRYNAGDKTVKGYTFEEFTDLLVEFLLLLHGRGCCFRDLSGGNLLVDCSEDEGLKFSLIDTARMRCSQRRLPMKQRVSDLERLILKLKPSLQDAFMEKYMKQLGRKYTASQRMSLKLYAWKTNLKRQKRRLSRKLGSKK